MTVSRVFQAGILKTKGDKKDTEHLLEKSMNINCGLGQDTFQLEYNVINLNTAT